MSDVLSKVVRKEKNQKICPLRVLDPYSDNGCVGDGCAWYDQNQGCCCLLSLAWDLKRLADCTNRGVFLTTKP